MLHLHVSVCISRCMKAETIMSVSDGDIKVIFYFFQMLCILMLCNKIEEKSNSFFCGGVFTFACLLSVVLGQSSDYEFAFQVL